MLNYYLSLLEFSVLFFAVLLILKRAKAVSAVFLSFLLLASFPVLLVYTSLKTSIACIIAASFLFGLFFPLPSIIKDSKASKKQKTSKDNMEHNPINSEKATFQSISDISSQETERLPVITEPEIQSHQKKAKYKDIAKKEPYKNIGKKEPYKNIGKKEPYKDIGKKEPYKDIEKKEPYKDILKKEDYKDVSAETSSFGSSPAAFNKDSMDYEIEMLVNDILNDFNSSHDFFDSKSSNAGNQPPNNKLEPIGHSFENSDPDIVHEKTLEDDGSDSKLKLMHKYGVNIESSLNVDEFLNSNVNVSGSLAEFISVVENMPTNDLKEIEALIRKLAFTSKDPNFAMKGIYAIQTMRRINT